MHIVKLPWFGHNMGCYTVAMSPDGSRLASGGLDGNVKIWNPQSAIQFSHISYDEENSLQKKNGIAKTSETGKNSVATTKNVKATSINFLDATPQIETRALCTMNRHNGAVTCLKFSPNGRFLASGSDDKIVLIWERDADGPRPKQFGEAEGDLEHWTVRKRLVAHENDVQDIAWSPDGSLLVTVGLDRSIIIWNGNTFERIKRYDIHQSMVKGVVFDPANKFFATASDDRTVRIFRYSRKHPSSSDHEFQMEHLVVDPFRKSPLTSYFRRMSWSPDGQHIAVPNATNGPVTSVAIINRGSWGTDISLIGHEAPCEVCSFSPRLFQIDPKSKDEFATIVATAGQDMSLAVWSTAISKPLVVAQDIVEDSITDICWTPDGQTLFMSCLDGSITCVTFATNELGHLAAKDINDIQLNRYGTDRESTIFAESVEQLMLEEAANKIGGDQPKLKPIEEKLEVKSEVINTTTPVIPTINKSKITKPLKKPSITITKDGKKRVAPLLVSSAKPSIPNQFTSSSSSTKSSTFQVSSKMSQTSYMMPRSGVATTVHGLKSRFGVNLLDLPKEANEEDNDNDEMRVMDENADATLQMSEHTIKKHRARMKRSIMEKRYPSYFRLVSHLPEVLFHHPNVINETISRASKSDIASDVTITSTYDTNDEELLFSVICNSVTTYENESEKITTTVEVRNGPSWNKTQEELLDYFHNDRVDFQDPTVVIVTTNKELDKRCYTLNLPYKVQHASFIVLNGIAKYLVIISFNGTLQFISVQSGALVCPSIELGSNTVVVRQSGFYFSCVTSSGLIYVWKLPQIVGDKIKGVIKGISLATIWNSQISYKSKVPFKGIISECTDSIDYDILAIEIDPESGAPFVMFSGSAEIYQYSIDMMCWIKIMDPWYFLAFDSVDELNTGSNATVKSLITKAFNYSKIEIEKGNKLKYVGDFNHLKKVMREKCEELISL